MRDMMTLIERLVAGAVVAIRLAAGAHRTCGRSRHHRAELRPDRRTRLHRQPDGASVYSWGYGCNTAPAPTRFVPATIAGATCPGRCSFPDPR